MYLHFNSSSKRNHTKLQSKTWYQLAERRESLQICSQTFKTLEFQTFQRRIRYPLYLELSGWLRVIHKAECRANISPAQTGACASRAALPKIIPELQKCSAHTGAGMRRWLISAGAVCEMQKKLICLRRATSEWVGVRCLMAVDFLQLLYLSSSDLHFSYLV